MADFSVDRVRRARQAQRVRLAEADNDVRLYRNLLALMPYAMPQFDYSAPPPLPELPEPEPEPAAWWPVRNGIRVPPPNFRFDE